MPGPPDRIWFSFLRLVHRSERGRGSPRFARRVDLAGSEKSKRPAVSHARKGDFVHFGASLRIMYIVVAHRPARRPLGIEAIPRLVIACYRSLSCSLFLPRSFSLSLSLSLSLVPFVSHRLAGSCMSKIRRTAHDKSCRDIDKPLLEIPARASGPSGTPEFTKHRHGDKFTDRGKQETRYRMISVIFASKYDTEVSREEIDHTGVRDYPLRVSWH